MRKLSHFAFVLLIGTTAVIFFTLLLSPSFLVADRKSSASRKGQVSIREEKEENRRSVSGSGLPNARLQFARTVSLDAHLLGRGFTDEQVKMLCHLASLFSPLPFAGLINSEIFLF